MLRHRSNPNHEPAGSSEGGQFAPGDGGGGDGGGGDSSGSSDGAGSNVKTSSDYTQTEKDQIREYQNGSAINGHLRDVNDSSAPDFVRAVAQQALNSPQGKALLSALDSSIAKGSMTKSSVIFRGINPVLLKIPDVGETFKDHAFVSATNDQKIASGFGNVVEIRVPAGTHALHVQTMLGAASRYHQGEHILPRDLTFRVVATEPHTILQIVNKSKGCSMSVIHKTHASETRGMEFVLSDATPDRYGDVILADGWDLRNFNKNPIALFGHKSDFPIGRWKNLQVKDGALTGHLEMAPLGTSDRIDEIRKLIEAGILKAVSVGFRPLESKPISKSAPGEIYVKSELVETSVVSVPANPNALAVVRSLGISRETQEMIFAKHGTEVTITERSGFNGKHAKSNSSGNRMKDMTPLAKRIEDVQTKVVGLRDQLELHLQGIDDDSPDDADTAVTDTLTQQLEASEKSLDSLKRAEVQLAKAASGTAVVTTTERSHERDDTQQLTLQRHRPFAMPAGPKPAPSDYLFKAIAADIKHFGEGRKRPILDVVKEHYGDSNEMGEIVRTVMSRMVTKAAAIPADTTTSGWADTLVQTVIGDFIQSLMPNSIYPALRAKGGSFTFGRNGTISLPARNTATTVAGAFVAQGAAIPVRQGAFTPITLTPKKMGVITTLTREITEHSTPAIEAILRQAMMEDTGVAIDTVLLDATAASSTRPAGLKNGISKVGASATASIVGFVADLTGLAAALITATAGNIRAPAWIMNPGDVLKASLLQTTTGDTPFRDELARGTLLGYPVLSTTTGLSDMMALIDAADFITATGDTPQFSVSDQAVLHMEDTTPLAIGTAGTPPTVAAPVRSLWQTDSLAIRLIMDINWAKRRTGIFQWTDTMAWN